MKSHQLLHSYRMSFTDVQWPFSSERGEVETVLSPGVHEAPSPGLARPPRSQSPGLGWLWQSSSGSGVGPRSKGLVCLGRDGQGARLPSPCPPLVVTSGDALS